MERLQVEFYDKLREIPSISSLNNELSAELLQSITSNDLGLRIIKGGTTQYAPVDKLKASGGELVTTSILLMLLIGYTRHIDTTGFQGSNGGFLLLDNPIGAANRSDLVDSWVRLADKLGFQLTFFTAIKDLGPLSKFPKIIVVNKSQRDTANNRELVSVSEVEVNDHEQEFELKMQDVSQAELSKIAHDEMDIPVVMDAKSFKSKPKKDSSQPSLIEEV